MVKQLADRQGFEPWNTFWMLLAFQASAFDRSATCPLPLTARETGAHDNGNLPGSRYLLVAGFGASGPFGLVKGGG
jgi:hypothetical protein